MTQSGTTAAARSAELRDVREAERLVSYLREMWQRRHYTAYAAKSDLRSRQMDSVLGNLWHLLNPILLISVYFTIFGLLLNTRRGVDNFFGYLAIGVFMYGYTQRSAMAGGRCLLKFRGIIQIINFPRAVLPVTTTVTEAFAMVAPLSIMLVVALASGEPPALSWLTVAPLFLCQTVFNAGVALVTARAVSHVADVQQLLPFVFRLGAYFSGVMFNVTAYVDGKAYETLFRLNPMYCFLQLNRAALLEGTTLDPMLLVTALCWTVATITGGFWWFRRAEDTYGDG